MITRSPKYLVLVSVHGLIRGHDLELGRDPDTGGQTQYVLELARALSQFDEVEQVDLVTRKVVDTQVSADYAEEIETLNPKLRIVRIEAGPEEYLPKEQLWDHLDSFTDNLTDFLGQQDRTPTLIHSHYADAGYVGVRLANHLSIPLVHTGHSLGRDKRKQLLARGLTRDEIEQLYNIKRRIDAEEEVLANADLVITSTHHEIDEQYSLYNFYNPERMRVNPPGTNLQRFYPPEPGQQFAFANEIEAFLQEPEKPIILALSRADERKNILALIEAYGESPELQEAANLVIVAGNRDDIRDLDDGPRKVLTNIMLRLDSYDLYGKLAIPKHHRNDQVPEIYRLVSASGGVFINPALTEPFGLTLLEAAASGIPLVATENGGPVDIIANCNNGLLVAPLDKQAIATALLLFLKDRSRWQQASENGIAGVHEHYSWQAHSQRYLQRIDQLGPGRSSFPQPLLSTRRQHYRDRALISDLDQNLIGDSHSLPQLMQLLRDYRRCATFGIATGRGIDTALALMKKHQIQRPDLLITGLGTRIHYGQNLTEDEYWSEHIDHHWSPKRIRRLLDPLSGLKRQPKTEQSRYKLSYFYDASRAPSIDEITKLLHQHDLTANVLCSFGQFLDVIPARASKGQALRYAAQRLDIPLEQILVAGGSGADEDMMRGNTLAAVVGNRHHEELSVLGDQEGIFFAQGRYAEGILEAINHYDFFNACRVPGND